MSLTHTQAKDKKAVLKEINKVKGDYKWSEDNFEFKPPKDTWLDSLKPKSSLKVELDKESYPYKVRLVGKSTSGGEVRTVVGTVKGYEEI